MRDGPQSRSAGQDGGWDRGGGQETGVQPGPQRRRLAQLPPAREVSCCNQSPVCVGLKLEPEPEQERPGRGGEGGSRLGFFPGGGLAAACSPPVPPA